MKINRKRTKTSIAIPIITDSNTRQNITSLIVKKLLFFE